MTDNQLNKPSGLKVGDKVVLDVEHNNSSVVTIRATAKYYSTVTDGKSDWEVMTNRLSAIVSAASTPTLLEAKTEAKAFEEIPEKYREWIKDRVNERTIINLMSTATPQSVYERAALNAYRHLLPLFKEPYNPSPPSTVEPAAETEYDHTKFGPWEAVPSGKDGESTFIKHPLESSPSIQQEAAEDRMIRAIREHTDKLIAEGPDACRRYLQEAGFLDNTTAQQEAENKGRGLKAFDDSMRSTLGNLLDSSPFDNAEQEAVDPTEARRNIPDNMDEWCEAHQEYYKDECLKCAAVPCVGPIEAQQEAIPEDFRKWAKAYADGNSIDAPPTIAEWLNPELYQAALNTYRHLNPLPSPPSVKTERGKCCNNCRYLQVDNSPDQTGPGIWCSKDHFEGVGSQEEADMLLLPNDCKDFQSAKPSPIVQEGEIDAEEFIEKSLQVNMICSLQSQLYNTQQEINERKKLSIQQEAQIVVLQKERDDYRLALEKEASWAEGTTKQG